MTKRISRPAILFGLVFVIGIVLTAIAYFVVVWDAFGNGATGPMRVVVWLAEFWMKPALLICQLFQWPTDTGELFVAAAVVWGAIAALVAYLHGLLSKRK